MARLSFAPVWDRLVEPSTSIPRALVEPSANPLASVDPGCDLGASNESGRVRQQGGEIRIEVHEIGKVVPLLFPEIGITLATERGTIG